MKLENEITVEVLETKENVIKSISNNGFKLEKEYDINDIYLVKRNLLFAICSVGTVVGEIVIMKALDATYGTGGLLLSGIILVAAVYTGRLSKD